MVLTFVYIMILTSKWCSSSINPDTKDEGVSLSATPGSSTDGGASSKVEVEVDTVVFQQAQIIYDEDKTV